MAISVLGPLLLDGSGEVGQRDRVVLAALATRPGHPVSVDQLCDALWGDRPPASAGKVLQGCVVRLRKRLGREAIHTSEQGYTLRLPDDDLDSLRFGSQVGRARELLSLGEPDRAAYVLGDALALWRGDAFADLEGWEPAIAVCTRLSELRLEAQELRVDAMLRAGRYREVLSEARALVRATPLREDRWMLLARAQYQSGQQGEALRTISRLKGVLAEHLGIDPGPDVVDLETSILRQDPELLVADAVASSTSCPWRGLGHYDVEDAEWFFGRDDDVAACLAVLERSPLLALVGPSGSGKSSLLRAGVSAAMGRLGEPSVTITPGSRPTEAVQALRAAPLGAALLVDQCEELFSMCGIPEERVSFLDTLVAESQSRTVAVALRADHLGDLAVHPEISRLVERGLYLVGGLDEDGLRSAVETPARQAGLHIEPGLVDLLIREVRNEPGALPLMSHALQETWNRREGNTLTVEGYRASGGINGAVAQSAEGLYSRIDEERRTVLRDLVLRLVSPGPEGEPVRTRVPRRLLATGPENDELIEMLVAARLVTSDDGALEISHEALTRAWPRLRGWLDDDVEGQRIRHHLSSAADAWAALDRPESELYRGVRLARAVEWASDDDTSLTAAERTFLDASTRAAETEQQNVVERARAQGRMIRRLRTALGAAAALLVVSVAAAGLAVVQQRNARENAALADQAAVSADARRVGARAQLTDDISLSLLLATAAVRVDESPETRQDLLAALSERPQLVRSALPEGGYLETLDVSRDGRYIASSDGRNRMHLYDAATNRLLRSYRATGPVADQGWILGSFSPDGKRLAVILNGQRLTEDVRILDTDTMRPVATLDVPGEAWGADVDVSADGRYVAAALYPTDWTQLVEFRDPGYVLVWDVRSPSTPPVRIATGTFPQGIALSPDGRILYTGWPLAAYDAATGRQLWERDRIRSLPSPVVTDDGTMLAVADTRETSMVRRTDSSWNALLLRASDGATVRTLVGHGDQVRDLRFSPDGSVLGSRSNDGELIVWDTASGRQLERWDTQAPWGVGFGPDGQLVHEGGGGSMLRTWDRAMRDTYLKQLVRATDADGYTLADLSPDGSQVALRWVDDTGVAWVRFVDTATGQGTRPIRAPAVADFGSWGTWRPDGKRYVGNWCVRSPCTPGRVTVLDATTGGVVGEHAVLDGDVRSMAYVDGGRTLLAGSFDRSLVLDADTFRPLGQSLPIGGHAIVPIRDGPTVMLQELSGDGTTVRWQVIDVITRTVLSEGSMNRWTTASAASPDGSTVAVAGGGEVVTIDLSTGTERRRTAGPDVDVLRLDYSADGQRLVTGSADGGVSLWDAGSLDLLGTVRPPQHGSSGAATAQFIGDTYDVHIASQDGRSYRWETSLDRALEYACRMAGRDLTEEEWKEFLPDRRYRSVCPRT